MKEISEVRREQETELLKHLRKEAFEVKHCFTQYSFQGLALVTAILGIALKFYEDNEYVGLAGVPLTLLLVTISSIGTHKYSTANRLLGYELHLQRSSRYPEAGAPGWRQEMRDLGWEEALRAWRIFQATVFEYLYVSGDLTRSNPRQSWAKAVLDKIGRVIFFWDVEKLRPNLINSKGAKLAPPEERWFETTSHLLTGMSYHAGGYLQTILNLIYVTAFMCLGLALHVGYRLWISARQPQAILLFIVVGLFAYWAFARFMHCYHRRKVLEEGLLSINSCAVLWQAVACAHFKTLELLSKDSANSFLSYKSYSRTLGSIAIDFCDNVFNLYDWYGTIAPLQTGQRTSAAGPASSGAA